MKITPISFGKVYKVVGDSKTLMKLNDYIMNNAKAPNGLPVKNSTRRVFDDLEKDTFFCTIDEKGKNCILTGKEGRMAWEATSCMLNSWERARQYYDTSEELDAAYQYHAEVRDEKIKKLIKESDVIELSAKWDENKPSFTIIE